jgi:hypothetical protein
MVETTKHPTLHDGKIGCRYCNTPIFSVYGGADGSRTRVQTRTAYFHLILCYFATTFSVSKGGIDKVCKYILNQPEHHKKSTFAEEYDMFMKFYQHTLGVK